MNFKRDTVDRADQTLAHAVVAAKIFAADRQGTTSGRGYGGSRHKKLAYFSSQHAQSVARLHVAIFRVCAIAVDQHCVTLAGSEKQILFDTVLPRVQIIVAAAQCIKL